MASQTERALARRAIGAASLMKQLTDYMIEQGRIQNVAWHTGGTIVLSCDKLIDIIPQMAPLIRETQELEGNLTSEKLRGRRYPSN